MSESSEIPAIEDFDAERRSAIGIDAPTLARILESMRRRDDVSPRPGTGAPVFTLATVNEDGSIGSRRTLGGIPSRPVGIVFGSITCATFRAIVPSVVDVAERVSGVDVHWVYVREAHPADGWRLPHNDTAGVSRRAHRTLGERARVAHESASALGLKLPLLIDDLDDRAAAAYAAWPVRLYVIGVDGQVVHQGGPGPWSVDVDTWAEALAAAATKVARRAEVAS